MPFQIYKLSNQPSFNAQRFELYFFDSNCWIFLLKSQRYTLGVTEQLYADLFTQIITLNTMSAAGGKAKVKPKIVITSLLLAELINAYMREVAMQEYCAVEQIPYKPGKFKQEYRDDPNTDYKTQLRRFVNDFSSFRDYMILEDDNFNEIDPFTILPGLENHNADFNDLYYYYSFADKNVAIVTHDGDFAFQDIPIITAHNKLIKLA